MALFAPVAPPQLLRGLRAFGDGIIGTYHLLLAHDVVAKASEYEGLLPKSSFVIMDNSMIELGRPVEPKVLAEACRIVRPNLIVLPDVYGDGDETARLSIGMAKEWAGILPIGSGWMAVPHGKTYEDITDCAYKLQDGISALAGWGIGRTVHRDMGTRKMMVNFLGGLMPKAAPNRVCVHLLGFSSSLQDDYECSQLPEVKGIDSNVPLRMGQQRKLISLDQEDPGPRGTFWDDDHSAIQPDTLANLYLVRSWFSGLRTFRSTVADPWQPTGNPIDERAKDFPGYTNMGKARSNQFE